MRAAVKKSKILNGVIVASIVLFTLEASPYLIFPILKGHSFSRSDVSAALLQTTSLLQESVEQSDGEEEYLGRNILHPYIGFVAHPGSQRNDFGFGGIEPIIKRSANEVNICLMGGSVAYGLYHTCKDRIISNLQKTAYFKDKEINMVLLALPGFKQPQQLISLNYFVALGTEYDLVINLDGFNEVALPFSENLPFGVYPSYPRHWNLLSRKKMNTAVLQFLGRQALERQERSVLRKTFSESIIRHTNFGLMIWESMDNKKNLSLYKLEGQLRAAILNSDKDYQATGPQIAFADTVQYFENLANMWQNSSAQMSALEEKGSFKYFHFLQPNQYLKGTKVLTEDELEKAYDSGPLNYKIAVEHGYPMLVEKGRELIELNVNYKDLTRVFQNDSRSIYNDRCCHYNQLGNEILADSIAKYVLTFYHGE